MDRSSQQTLWGFMRVDTGALRVNEGNSQHYLQSKNYTQANKINKK